MKMSYFNVCASANRRFNVFRQMLGDIQQMFAQRMMSYKALHMVRFWYTPRTFTYTKNPYMR